MSKYHLLFIGAALILGACKTTPEPEMEAIVIEPEPIMTCTPISKVQKVEIPAETETYFAITQIDNPPYEPIERREEITRVVKEAQIIYVDSEGREVLDVCADDLTGETATETVVTGDGTP